MISSSVFYKAFLDALYKALIPSCCLICFENSSTCQRQPYNAATVCTDRLK